MNERNEFRFNRLHFSYRALLLRVDQKHGFVFPPRSSLYFTPLFQFHLSSQPIHVGNLIPLSSPVYLASILLYTHTCLFAPSRFSHSGHRNGVKLFRYFIPSSLVRRIIPDVSRGVEKRSGAVYLSQKAFFFFFLKRCSQKNYESNATKLL